MKKVKLYSLILFLVVCLSTITYAAETFPWGRHSSQGYVGYTETVKTEDPGQATITQSRYSLVTKPGTTFVADNGTTFTMTENGYTLNGQVVTATINIPGGRTIAINAGSIRETTGESYKDDPLYMIDLGTVEIDYADITITFSYTDASGNIVTTQGSPNIGSSNTHSVEVTEEKPGFFATAWGLLTDTADTVTRLVEEVLTELLLPLGDGVVYTISKSVGEVVTVDRLVFNAVDKVNVDYWDKSGDSDSIRAIMSKVVVPWYNVFYKIAIFVYMMVLVVIGIVIMFGSTAESKAKYNQIFTSWVVGVAILTMFPYVMKYIVKLNDAVVTAMYDYLNPGEPLESMTPDFLGWSGSSVYNTFGKDEFVQYMTGVTIAGEVDVSEFSDSMMLTRLWAQKFDKIVLVGIYFILIGQMMVLLFMYYKRAFMLAFLITIFPLVTMTYVLDKIGDKKAQSFGIWFKEYLVNVIVQMFHAIVYVLLVGSGVRNYIENGGTNWLFLIYSVLFLFQGEKILRNIFGIKSAANTIGDLATAAVALKAFKDVPKMFSGDKGNIAGEQDAAAASDVATRQEQRASGTQPLPPKSSAGGIPQPPPRSSAGQYTGRDPAGVATAPFDSGAAQDKVTKNALKRRMKRGLASGAVHKAGNITGAFLGATYGMAQGEKGDSGLIGNAVSGAIAGKEIGDFATQPLQFAANKAEQKWHGHREANKIASGSQDKALGLDALNPVDLGMGSDVDPDEIIGKHGETFQEIVRKALAEQARVTASKGAAKGKLAFMQYMENNTTKRRWLNIKLIIERS